MITNTSNSTTSNSTEYQKYYGVASLKVVAVDPSMKVLNDYGFNVTEEPTYVREVEDKDDPSKTWKYHNLRILCAIDEFEEHPLVSIYFRLYNDVNMSKDGEKMQIIDAYGNTAWATKEDVRTHAIPTYSNGNKAKIDKSYRPCHRGEEEFITFLKKYLNITPYERYDRATGKYVLTKNPGKCYLDDWKSLVNGNTTEVIDALKMQPDNLIKVILGVRTDDDNKVRQCFIDDFYLSYGATPTRGDDGRITYPAAEKAIARWMEGGYHDGETYIPDLVKPYNQKPDEVKQDEEPLDGIDSFPF